MSTNGLGRRTFCLGVALAAAAVATARVAGAQSTVAEALRDLAQSDDFRVRVSAAVYLGRMGAPGARPALEHALSDEHPAVRVAAAAALGVLGAPAAIPVLSRRMSTEGSASVRAQIRASLERLRHSPGPPDPWGAARAGRLRRSPRFLVCLGAMKNGSGVGGEEVRLVLERAVRARSRSLAGAELVDGAPIHAGRVPVLTLDGWLRSLIESSSVDGVREHARVELVVLRNETLRATLTGAATTWGSGHVLSSDGRRQLQEGAVDGAVQSALRGVEHELMV